MDLHEWIFIFLVILNGKAYPRIINILKRLLLLFKTIFGFIMRLVKCFLEKKNKN